jgi:co-chaperonin GroES (HSP10)
MSDHKAHQSQTHMHERGPHFAHLDKVQNNATTRGGAAAIHFAGKHSRTTTHVSGVGTSKIAGAESIETVVAKACNCALLESDVGTEVKIEGDDHLVVHDDGIPADVERRTSTD